MRRSHTQSVTKEEADTINARSWIEKHPNVAKALIGAGAALAAGALAYGAYKAAPYAEYAYGELVTGADELRQLAEQREAIFHTEEPPEVTLDTEMYRQVNQSASKFVPEDLVIDGVPYVRDQGLTDLVVENMTRLPRYQYKPEKGVKRVPMTLKQRQKQHEYMTQHAPDLNPVIRDKLFGISHYVAVENMLPRTPENIRRWNFNPSIIRS